MINFFEIYNEYLKVNHLNSNLYFKHCILLLNAKYARFIIKNWNHAKF